MKNRKIKRTDWLCAHESSFQK